jgi:hypothetical protein
MQHALRAVRERHHGVLHARRERPGDDRVAREKTGKGVWVGGLPDDARVAGGKAIDAHERVRRTNHAGPLAGRAEDAGGRRDVHADRRSLRVGDAGDAGEGARDALHARAEERRGAKGGAGER